MPLNYEVRLDDDVNHKYWSCVVKRKVKKLTRKWMYSTYKQD